MYHYVNIKSTDLVFKEGFFDKKTVYFVVLVYNKRWFSCTLFGHFGGVSMKGKKIAYKRIISM